MKVVLAGCGAMSQTWLKTANSLNLEMVGFVDIYEEAARNRAVSSVGLRPASEPIWKRC